MNSTKLLIVVPCYNEEEIIADSASALKEKLHQLMADGLVSDRSRILFVNDGSKDRTKDILIDLCKSDQTYNMLSFVRNFGHQSAILAGMEYAAEHADACITIDADLQQDINAMDDFIRAYDKGAEVVYGVRNDRSSDSAFKKLSAEAFYSFIRALGVNTLANAADYRLLSSKALKGLKAYGESNLFLRGLIPYMGFPSDIVRFDVKPREKGHSKYTLMKMFTLAMDGITSFSNRPLTMILMMGLTMCLISFIMIADALITYFEGRNITGYTTNIVSIWLVGGMLMFSIGVVGEYIGKMYMEVKKRPRYMIDSAILESNESDESDEVQTEITSVQEGKKI